MSNKPWLYALLISIGLLGCTTTPDRRAAQQDLQPFAQVGCTPGQGRCFVNLWVTNCADKNGIKADPDPLEVPERGFPKHIRWKIATEGYVFASNGIVIKQDPDGEFVEPDLSPDGRVFKLKNKHSKKGTYDYAINVVKTGENPRNCEKYDPVISNQ